SGTGIVSGLMLRPATAATGSADAEAGEVTAEVDWPQYTEKALCYSKLRKNYGGVWTAVGEAYNTTGVTHTFTFTGGASSKLGIGISATGAWGSFKQEGTK